MRATEGIAGASGSIQQGQLPGLGDRAVFTEQAMNTSWAEEHSTSLLIEGEGWAWGDWGVLRI